RPPTIVGNLSLNKTFPFADGRSIDVRAQASNIFNTPQFLAIDTAVNSPTFGRVTSVGPMREKQILARFNFLNVIMKKLVLGSVIAALLPLNVGSQTPSTSVSPSSSQGQFTLKTSTEVVLVNVTVRDKNDNFIKDLKLQDFSILEDGKKQEIVSIDVENT